ncbi:TPA: peptidoglycan bridge formation glycyltransferase FemA/FemB family protein [Streptococcus suis]
MSLELITDELFQEHIKKANRQFYEQSPQMATHLRKRGYTVQILAYVVEKEIQISAIVYSQPIAGGYRMELHNGPIVTDSAYLHDFFKQLQDFAKTNNVIELVVKPYIPYQYFDSQGTPTSEPNDLFIEQLTSIGYTHSGLQRGFDSGNWYYLKDLSQLDSKTLLPSFNKNGQQLVKKARGMGIQIEKLPKERLELFKAITNETAERNGFLDKDLEYYHCIFDAFGEDASFLSASIDFQEYLNILLNEKADYEQHQNQIISDFGATPTRKKQKSKLANLNEQLRKIKETIEEVNRIIEKHGNGVTPLAVGLFAYLDKEAYYLHSGSSPEFCHFPAPSLLQEFVMLEAIKRGCQTYNFLCFSGQFDGKDGVLRFKQNFNGYIMRTPGVFTYLPSPYKYHFYRLVKKLLRRL